MTKTATRRPVADPPALPGPRTTTTRWDRSPATLALFKCAICGHSGLGRLDSPALTCSGCGQVGAAVPRAAPKPPGAAA